MLKRSLLFAGVAGALLIVVVAGASLLAAAEPAPKAPENAAAPAPQKPEADAPVVTEEESITIVAVPGGATAGECAKTGAKTCPDGKNCADRKSSPGKKHCAGIKNCAIAPTPEYSDSDYELAYTLMEAGGVPTGIDDANTFLIVEQMEQMPMLKPAQPAFEKFFDDHCSYKAMKRDLARIHLAAFTRDEMRKIIDFFHTPEGKKLAACHAGLTRRTLALRADRINRNLPELQLDMSILTHLRRRRTSTSA